VETPAVSFCPKAEKRRMEPEKGSEQLAGMHGFSRSQKTEKYFIKTIDIVGYEW